MNPSKFTIAIPRISIWRRSTPNNFRFIAALIQKAKAQLQQKNNFVSQFGAQSHGLRNVLISGMGTNVGSIWRKSDAQSKEAIANWKVHRILRDWNAMEGKHSRRSRKNASSKKKNEVVECSRCGSAQATNWKTKEIGPRLSVQPGDTMVTSGKTMKIK